MADLAGGKYPQNAAMAALLGNLVNEVQSNIPARGNHEFGLGGVTDGVTAATGVAFAVPIPIDPGTVVTRFNMFIGGTAASTPTHCAVALYSGIATPAKIGTQGTDTTTTAIAASVLFQQALGAPYMIKPADCPNGYIYAAWTGTATANPTAAAFLTTAAVNIQYFTASTAPAAVMPMLSATSGSALAGVMPATLTLVAKAVAPWVVLT